MTILTMSVGRLCYGRLEKFGISEKKDMHGLRGRMSQRQISYVVGAVSTPVSTSPPIVVPLWPIKTKPVNTHPSPSSAAVKIFNIWERKKYKLHDQLRFTNGSEAKEHKGCKRPSKFHKAGQMAPQVYALPRIHWLIIMASNI